MRKIGGELTLSSNLFDYEIIFYLNQFTSFFSIDRDSTCELNINNSKFNILTTNISTYFNNLKEFAELNNIENISDSERSIESLLGMTPPFLYEAPFENWLVLSYFNESAQDQGSDTRKEINDWAPPDNFAYGTDDEKEIYKDFWKNKNKI